MSATCIYILMSLCIQKNVCGCVVNVNFILATGTIVDRRTSKIIL